MIKENMFYGDVTIKDYREIDPREVIREYLLSKGTRQIDYFTNKVSCINKTMTAKQLISSGLFVYGLKDNPTNRNAIEYYCERWAQREGILRKVNNLTNRKEIFVPEDLWLECDRKNEEFTMGNDRKPKVD